MLFWGRFARRTAASLAYTYGDSAHAHAATRLAPGTGTPNTYTYDANGSQIERAIANDGQYQLLYNADIVPAGENRVVEVKKNNATIAQFTYDGDGKRVKSTADGQTTVFVGGHYEKTGSAITKYYFAGSTRIAMRKYTVPVSATLEFILGDHLGSTSLTTDSTGAKTSEMRYTAWGEVRYTWGSTFTNYTYTGQYSNVPEFGLMFYNARWYDPGLGRFTQADTIIPLESQGTQAWDRYAGMNNNPVRYNDPSGHDVGCPGQDAGKCPPKPKPVKPKTQAGIILLECGATGPSINAQGENCGISGSKGDLTGWGATMQKQYPDYTPIYVPYPGTKAGQQSDTEKIIEKHPGVPVVIVGFSAGADTGVVVADNLHNAGTQVHAVILLDPPFAAGTLGMPENSDFDKVVQGLVTSNGPNAPAVPVFIADAYGGIDTAKLSVSQTDTAFYRYKSYPRMDHYPVINSPYVRNDIYDFFGWPR